MTPCIYMRSSVRSYLKNWCIVWCTLGIVYYFEQIQKTYNSQKCKLKKCPRQSTVNKVNSFVMTSTFHPCMYFCCDSKTKWLGPTHDRWALNILPTPHPKTKGRKVWFWEVWPSLYFPWGSFQNYKHWIFLFLFLFVKEMNLPYNHQT